MGYGVYLDVVVDCSEDTVEKAVNIARIVFEKVPLADIRQTSCLPPLAAHGATLHRESAAHYSSLLSTKEQTGRVLSSPSLPPPGILTLIEVASCTPSAKDHAQ